MKLALFVLIVILEALVAVGLGAWLFVRLVGT